MLGNPLEIHQSLKDFYHSVNLDARKVVEKLTVNDRKTLSVKFRTAAEVFRLIEDEDTATVVVLYAQAKDDMGMLLASLDTKGPERWLMRKLQRYTVSIRKRVADKMLEQGSLKTSVLPGLYVQVGASGLYDEKLGLYTEGVPFDALGNVF